MNITLIIIGALVLAFVIYIYSVQAKIKKTPMVVDHQKIITLTDKNFEHQVKNKTMLIDFWASWCAPCRMMAPTLNEIADELSGNNYVGKVNIEQYQTLAQRYKVRNIPTMILLRNGEEVDRFVGVKNKEFLMNQFKKRG